MRLSLSLLLVLAVSPLAAHPLTPPSPEAAMRIEQRIDDLLARMSLEEKVGQLTITGAHLIKDGEIEAGRVGAVMNAVDPAMINDFQHRALASRLGIPILFGLDAVHGYRTMFPLPLGQASTWNLGLIESAAYWTAREAAAIGQRWTFAPMVDMSRDPRWGRVLEGAGEDVFYASLVAAARVRGYQRGGLAATVKHFAGYGAVEQGRDYNSTWIPTAQLYETYLPPFRSAIDAGALTVMAAFNALNGVPATANRPLLSGILKRDWGFDGVVSSDFDAIGQLRDHGVARDLAEAARLALLAGVDLDMLSYAYRNHLPAEVEAGRVPISAVDAAVRRVLRLKFRLGLFDEGDIDNAQALAAQETPEARRAAREVARESLILLKNDADPLPLGRRPQRIAVIGPLATFRDDNPWPGPPGSEPPEVETLLTAMQRLAPAGVSVDYARGVDTTCGREFDDKAGTLALAAHADVIVAVLGEDCTEMGEAASRTRLDLPGKQPELLEALTRTGKPVVLVLMTGRPLVLTWADAHVGAILQTFHPGTEGRTAIAEALFGLVNPSGKTVFSYPRSVGQIPIYYDQLPTGRPAVPGDRWKAIFLDEEVTPLYPFGFGLSYTRFRYSDLEVITPRVGRDGTVEVAVTLTNVGPLAGKEVAELYVHQLVASRSRPVRELEAFEKVALAPGESRRLVLRMAVAALAFPDDEGHFHVEPGLFDVFVGGDARAELSGRFEVE